jgi:putative transposase
VSDVYAAIEPIVAESHAATAAVCEVLDVSRSAYYAWRSAEPSTREQRGAELSPRVREIFWRHRRRYGARRIARELTEAGHPCSPRKAADIMRNQSLKAIQPKSFKPRTTDSRHRLGYNPNLLLDEPSPTRPNQLWVGDITYIPLADRSFCYLAMLMDRHSRLIVGWRLDTSMTDALTAHALKQALRRRQPPANLIHHSDRGGQYASRHYRTILRRAGFRQSMSRADNCYDNAFIESCFGTIKTELEMTEYQNQRVADGEIAEYLRYYDDVSHCVSFLFAGKCEVFLFGRWYYGLGYSLTDSLEETPGCLRLQSAAIEYPRAIAEWMLSFDNAVLNG